MKIDDSMRFPHPVLWAQTSDYSQGGFAFTCTIEESMSDGRLDMKCEIELTQPAISGLLQGGRAGAGLFVSCIDTYFNQLFQLPAGGGKIVVPGGRLRGRVVLRPVVWARERIESYSSPDVHAEFGTGPIVFEPASILAVGESQIISVGSDKLAPMGSIFDLARDDDVPISQVRVQLDGERIQILASEPTLEKIQVLRGTPEGKALLLNSVYLPVVMAVLDVLSSDAEAYEGRRWHSVFTAKLDQLGISADGDDLLEPAQRLLKSPFARLDTVMQGTQ
jgi:hypothetical protein